MIKVVSSGHVADFIRDSPIFTKVMWFLSAFGQLIGYSLFLYDLCRSVSSESQDVLFFGFRVTLGIHWSAANRRTSLKCIQQSSIDSVRKQQFHGILLRSSRKALKSALLKLYISLLCLVIFFLVRLMENCTDSWSDPGIPSTTSFSWIMSSLFVRSRSKILVFLVGSVTSCWRLNSSNSSHRRWAFVE